MAVPHYPPIARYDWTMTSNTLGTLNGSTDVRLRIRGQAKSVLLNTDEREMWLGCSVARGYRCTRPLQL